MQLLGLLKANFNPLVTKAQSVEDLVRYSVDLSGSIEDFVTKPTIVDSQISQFKGKTDLLVGGPLLPRAFKSKQ